MKKVKGMLFLSMLIFILCYLSSCMRNSIEPKVYMYNPEVTFSTMEFDLKVVEPEEILVKEIYIKLYKENELEKTLTSNDGINKVGATENICFRKLDAKTRYKLEFAFDYFEQDYENEDVVIYSYSFTTQEDIGISGTLFNYSQDPTGIVHIDAMIEDENELATSYDFYVYKDADIIKHYDDKKDGLGIGQTAFEFRLLFPNEEYKLILSISFVYNEEVYENFILDCMDIKIDDYFKAPSVQFSNVLITEDRVSYDILIKNDLKLIADLSIVLMDFNGIILETTKVNINGVITNTKFYFEHLFPDSSYTLKAIANYKTPEGLIENASIGEYSFRTDAFSMVPKATITLNELTDYKINFSYEIKDIYSLITSLRCEIRDIDDKLLKTLDLTNNTDFTISMNRPSDLQYFKINFLADYTYLLYNKKNALIGSLEQLENPIQDFEFEITSNNAGIIKYIGQSQVCSIPKMIDGRKVTYIESYAFSESDVTHVIIPDTITSIRSLAFMNCSSLESVTFSDGLEVIQNGAFKNCSNLKNTILPNSIKSIQSSAFSGCSNLTSIYLPNSITWIEGSVFEGCSSLISLVIPNAVERIFSSTFKDCSNLESIMLPDSITIIEPWSFEGCSSLTSILIPNGVTSIGESAFKDCSSLKSITIPDGVTAIENHTFENCSNLESIILPESVVSIGYDAFWRSGIKIATGTIAIIQRLMSSCALEEINIIGKGSISFNEYNYQRRLISVTIGNSITRLDDKIFAGCDKLENITIGNGVTSIGSFAFSGCSSLKNIILPKGIESIEGDTFHDCINLMSVHIPEGITRIGNSAFYNCKKLEEITIPDSVISIGLQAFYGCRSLKSLIIPDNVTNIGSYAFFGCSSLENVVLPKNIESIEHATFRECSSLKNINIPEGVTEIKTEVFAYCSNLKSIVLPESVKSIDFYAFFYCSGLESINIPEGVITIGESAFGYCCNLQSIIIPNSVISIESHAFSNCNGLVIYCEASSMPSGWDYAWAEEDKYSITVHWGYQKEI